MAKASTRLPISSTPMRKAIRPRARSTPLGELLAANTDHYPDDIRALYKLYQREVFELNSLSTEGVLVAVRSSRGVSRPYSD